MPYSQATCVVRGEKGHGGMVYHQTLQRSRYELKYLISEDVAASVRSFVRQYLDVDEHADRSAGNSYAVHSLYLDSPALMLFYSTVHGLRNRFKLRIRFYDDDPQHPAYLEIKRRLSDVILKERAAVTREAARQLIRGAWLDRGSLIGGNGDPRAAAALHNFCKLTHEIAAQGCVYVSYVREAYVSPGSNQVRVTFDRNLCAARYMAPAPLAVPYETVPVTLDPPVILELKFTDRFPEWMRSVVQMFNLWRRSVAKYIYCLRAVGAPWGSGAEMEVAT